MSDSTALASSTARYRPETRLVHSGTLRSSFGETSEALFLTQGFVYDSAEQCEALATRDRQRDAIERGETAEVGVGDALDRQQRFSGR